MKETTAISLILGSLMVLICVGSGIEAVPADAGWLCWTGIWATVVVAVLNGIIGVRSL